jgi:cytoskeletal protein RodZ
MFEKLSEELKQARIKNNISIQQLSTVTRIDIKFLEAMESEDFSFLPELYVKGFVKQYAKAVDLDENVIIKKYEAIKKGLPYEEEPPKPDIKKPIELAKESRDETPVETEVSSHVFDAVKTPVSNPDFSDKNKKRITLISVFVVIIALFAVVYFFFLHQSHEIIVPEKSFEEVMKENKQRFVDNEKKDSIANKSSLKSDSLSLTIFSKDTSWIKIILDDKETDEFILFPQSQKTVSAENNYKITFGNSGGIVLELNNKPLNFSGKKYGVKYVLINKNGLKYLTNQPEL